MGLTTPLCRHARGRVRRHTAHRRAHRGARRNPTSARAPSSRPDRDAPAHRKLGRKTVGCACGRCRSAREQYLLVDLPGTYSLQPHSAEEAVACDFVRGGKADAVVVVCDATCLERTLVLALQMHSVTPNTIVCVNLLDEARHKRIHIDLPALQAQLGMPVVGVTARKKKKRSAPCSTRSTPLWQRRSRARTVRRRPETPRTMCAAQRSSAVLPSGGRRRNMPRVTGGSTACSRAVRPATPSCCWGWQPCCG